MSALFLEGGLKEVMALNINKNVTSCATTCKELLLVISQFYCNLCFHTVNCLLPTFLSEFMFD